MRTKKILIAIIAAILFFNINVFAKKEQKETIVRSPILSKFLYDKKVQQIICVHFVEGSTAIFKMYVRDATQDNGWNLILATDAFVGQGGIDKEQEGDLKTPTGEFNVTKAFGIKPNPGTSLEYIRINDNLYACDEEGEYYNQIIDSQVTNHACKGEHLINYVPQYNYGLCIDFNPENIFPNGSNIFIHVKGNKVYTAGCIAIDEESMIKVLKNVTNKTKVAIYEQ